MSNPLKKVAGSDVVTPRSSLLRESVRVEGGVLWSSNNFKRGENYATQERSKCSTVIVDTIGVHVRPVGVYVGDRVLLQLCLDAVDSCHSVA